MFCDNDDLLNFFLPSVTRCHVICGSVDMYWISEGSPFTVHQLCLRLFKPDTIQVFISEPSEAVLFVHLSSRTDFTAHTHWEIWWKVKPWAKSLMWWWDKMRWHFHLLMNLMCYELLMDVVVGLYGQLLFLRFKNAPLFSNKWTLMVNAVRQSIFKQRICHIYPYYCPYICLYCV